MSTTGGETRAATLYRAAYGLIQAERPRDAAPLLRAMVLADPSDERGWLGLGWCHEALAQTRLALELYGVGRVLAGPSARCEIARARIFRALGRHEDAENALDEAERIAEDEETAALVAAERRAS